MGAYNIELIETVVVIVAFIMLKFIIIKPIEKIAKKFKYQGPRVKHVKKFINTLLFLFVCGLLLFIWGVDQSELVFFVTTLLTILGIAFFAQWSLISNITSALIIYFNHPTKIGDSITIIDKDYQIEGRISDIGMFFIIIKNPEGEKITIPNNVFTQKMVKRRTVN